MQRLSEGQKILMFRRVFISTALVSALVAASMGTAHAATVPAAKWAPKFCTAIQQYQTTITSQSDAVGTALSSVTDLQTARDQLSTYLSSMVDAAKTAATAVQKAGSPSTTNGDKIAAKFVAGLQASSKLFAKAQTKAGKLSTTDAQAFAVDGKKLGSDLSSAGDELSKGFSGIGKLDKGKKLEAAVKAAPECSFLL
jgi:hypothetical protein